jgi:hypothetical protein
VQSHIISLSHVILSNSTLSQFETDCVRAIIYNTSDDTGDDIFSCSDCHRPPREAEILGCPLKGAEGKSKVDDFPGLTCPGWFFAHEESAEILELRAMSEAYGVVLKEEPYIVTQILRDLRYLENERLWKIKRKKDKE